MDSGTTQVVWFKRDLRVADHLPLSAALQLGPTLALYIVEPELWRQPDHSWRQWLFLRDALVDLDQQLRLSGGRLCVRFGDAVHVLRDLRSELGAFVLHAHEETGTAWTYARDKAVAAWCKANATPFMEARQFGVVRGLASRRQRWSAQWNALMQQPLVCLPETRQWQACRSNAGWYEWQPPLDIDAVEIQSSRRDSAVEALRSFLHARGERYHLELSSPRTAPDACSRLSAYLAHGTLSMREVVQATRRRQAETKSSSWGRAVQAFEGRLHWHCHFVQRLESEPELEFENLARSMDGMRERDFDEQRFSAWCEGQTGYPLVDACMRYLSHTGWLNFRMRAMLVSFAAYDLWLHWRQPALHLAKMFVDYEPGIHFSQMQMQSGTTGINAIRIYNPIKQSQDHDPEGHFIRQWVPELAGVGENWIHEPWKMSATEQGQSGCVIGRDYPGPIVDHAQAVTLARAALRRRQSAPGARSEARRNFDRHGSRRRMRDRAARSRSDQMDLDFS